jgi:hypothetical protein
MPMDEKLKKPNIDKYKLHVCIFWYYTNIYQHEVLGDVTINFKNTINREITSFFIKYYFLKLRLERSTYNFKVI